MKLFPSGQDTLISIRKTLDDFEKESIAVERKDDKIEDAINQLLEK